MPAPNQTRESKPIASDQSRNLSAFQTDTNSRFCQCGAASVVTWLGSPPKFRVRCSRCDWAVARQATEAEAIALWNDLVTGKRKPTHEVPPHG